MESVEIKLRRSGDVLKKIAEIGDYRTEMNERNFTIVSVIVNNYSPKWR